MIIILCGSSHDYHCENRTHNNILTLVPEFPKLFDTNREQDLGHRQNHSE